MSFENSFLNLTKVFRNWTSGRTMSGESFASISSYHCMFNLISGLLPGTSRIKIRCIMCGFPRSGTHWIRNVIEKSTGQKTYDLYKNSPPQDVEDILLVKIHARSRIVARSKARLFLRPHNFDWKYIYTYRDPRDTMISLFEMYKARKKLPDLEAKEFIKLYDPIRQYRWEIGAWVARKCDNVFLVKFEDLRLFPVKGFLMIFKYLGLKSQVNEVIIDERVAAADLAKRPRGAVGGWKHAGHEYRWLIDEITKQLGREMKLLGYDQV